MVSLGVSLCSMTRSEAERKDSGTFLCAALSVNPTNQLGSIFPKLKPLSSLKQPEARAEATAIRL